MRRAADKTPCRAARGWRPGTAGSASEGIGRNAPGPGHSSNSRAET